MNAWDKRNAPIDFSLGPPLSDNIVPDSNPLAYCG